MKKLLTMILACSFVLTIVGGAFADTTPTTDPGSTTTTTTTTTTSSTIDTTTSPSSITTTTPVVSPDIVDVNIVEGALKSVVVSDKTITVSVKDKATTFTYDDKTAFVLNGQTITPDAIPVDSKVVVKSVVYSDNSVRVIKVVVTNLEEKAYPGTVSAVNATDSTITVTFANKKSSKVFTYDANTQFIYKGKTVAASLIVPGTKVVVKYQLLADKTLKVTKVQVVELPKPKKDNKHKETNKTKTVKGKSRK